ncbi:Transposase [Enhygromyxa salina]|uniref:Transposase n=1 Tax=Enhygromyxa salina TaxID=215803 RepID=A0A0C2DA18_9BACT|nr:hypothetical protein [Enhygromyxa salina]KIG18400.1 Transposase [Enhygromyxa salina]
MRSRLILSLVPALLLVAGCGDDIPGEFDSAGSPTDSSGTATDTGVPADLPETGGPGETTGDGDGDPGGTGDGDGDGDGDPDPTTGGSVCGDGAVDPGEQCDTDDLKGQTCESLGYASGMLACDPVTCTYDASDCMIDMDGGSGGTTG